MPILRENDITLSITITQSGTDSPVVLVNATTTNDLGLPGRTLATKEVYTSLGTSVQAQVRGILTSIKARIRTDEGI